MKRFLMFFVAVALLAGSVGAFAVPTAEIHTKGVSPRDVARDTTDIFTKPASGLPNVGVGEIVYLEGNPEDTTITAWAWELTARPNGSNAALNANDDEIVTLVPDMVGTFRVTLRVTDAEGQSDPMELAINSANYVGVGGITGAPTRGQCAMCHDEYAAEWAETNHSSAFTRKYSGEIGTRFRATCVSCHTTGYNATQGADNAGFDDRARAEGWVFIDSANGGLREGAFDRMKESHPQTANMANVQCESCHGPGGSHNARTDDNRMVSSIAVGACAQCHDSGSRHFRPYQWYLAGHSSPVEEERTGCADCHGGLGFIDQLNGVPDSLSRIEYTPISCAVCHDPHNATNTNQVRTEAPYTLANGVEVDFGVGNLCVNCHHARRSGEREANAANITSRYGPHYGVQGDMLKGTNAFTFGADPVSTPHAQAVEGVCVGCHMAPSPNDPNDPESYLKVGDHTFHMKSAEGYENVAACAECHGEIDSFESMMADGDWDGDGATEGVSAEIDGLMDNLFNALPNNGTAPIRASWLTPNQRRALWNWTYVRDDGSNGYHNPAYTKQILQAALAQDLGVSPVEGDLPGEYALNAAYPNPFNPVSAFTYSVANEGQVTIKVFDLAGREVSTLVSENQKAGTYRAPINMMGKAAGVYLLKMEAGSFTATQKLALVK